jgi:hypothetical protein
MGKAWSKKIVGYQVTLRWLNTEIAVNEAERRYWVPGG